MILHGDCRDVLKTLPDNSVQCCVTSPPYFGLRSYLPEQHPDKAREIGAEPTPEEYINTMVGVFREVKRVLREDGVCWINWGDTYAANRSYQIVDNKHCDVGNHAAMRVPNGLKPKDLIGIPWRAAFALQADGWYLRQDIIWNKPNPMPESVTDRCTKSHEYLFLLTKSARYYYDNEAVKENRSEHPESVNRAKYPVGKPVGQTAMMGSSGQSGKTKWDNDSGSSRNRRSVWTVNPQPFSDAHFAVFPPKLIEPCILAGTSERGCCSECGKPWERVVEREKRITEGRREQRDYPGYSQRSGKVPGSNTRGYPNYDDKTIGWQPACTCNAPTKPCVVLDPFGGSGTTGQVAQRLGRDWILIELNPEYLPMIERRTQQTALCL